MGEACQGTFRRDEPTSDDLKRIDRALKIRADQPRRRIAVLEHVVHLANRSL